jgi:hypothetical protein
MKQFVAVVSNDSGKITKYQDFDLKAAADSHVASFGGKVVEGLDNNLVYWDVSGDSPVKDADQLAADDTAREWSALRSERNKRLSDTDFYAMSDVTLADNMKSYRQTLRDLPANTADPASPSWPSKP